MSEVVTALGGVTFKGGVSVSEMPLQGLITLRCDLEMPALQQALQAILGLAVPGMRTVVQGDECAVAWMSPDELLVFVPYPKVSALTVALNEALESQHSLVVNVSDARALFEIVGDGAREVIAKLTPTDLRPAVLSVGVMCRSRLGQVAGAFWLTGDNTLRVICFRSVAAYVYNLLTDAADKGAQLRYF